MCDLKNMSWDGLKGNAYWKALEEHRKEVAFEFHGRELVELGKKFDLQQEKYARIREEGLKAGQEARNREHLDELATERAEQERLKRCASSSGWSRPTSKQSSRPSSKQEVQSDGQRSDSNPTSRPTSGHGSRPASREIDDWLRF